MTDTDPNLSISVNIRQRVLAPPPADLHQFRVTLDLQTAASRCYRVEVNWHTLTALRQLRTCHTQRGEFINTNYRGKPQCSIIASACNILLLTKRAIEFVRGERSIKINVIERDEVSKVTHTGETLDMVAVFQCHQLIRIQHVVLACVVIRQHVTYRLPATYTPSRHTLLWKHWSTK